MSRVIACAHSLGHPDVLENWTMEAWSRITEAKEKVYQDLFLVIYLNNGEWRLVQTSQKVTSAVYLSNCLVKSHKGKLF